MSLLLTIEHGPLKGRKFNALLDLIEAQDKIRATCKHQLRFRRVESGLTGKGARRRGWVRVRCTRCGDILENHTTPVLKTKVPDHERSTTQVG